MEKSKCCNSPSFTSKHTVKGTRKLCCNCGKPFEPLVIEIEVKKCPCGKYDYDLEHICSPEMNDLSISYEERIKKYVPQVEYWVNNIDDLLGQLQNRIMGFSIANYYSSQDILDVKKEIIQEVFKILSSNTDRVKSEITKGIKQKGLHLGYANTIIEIINNIK